jgi:hypothetical protein
MKNVFERCKRVGTKPCGSALIAIASLLAFSAFNVFAESDGTNARPHSCDQHLEKALRSLTDTTVVQIKSLPKGFRFTAEDWHLPAFRPEDAGRVGADGFLQVELAADMCLVKLLVGPGYTTGVTPADPQYSKGIGIEVWLPTPKNWNRRIRNYGGGGFGRNHH